MSSAVIILLAILVGVALGALGVLYFDLRSWGSRLKMATDERKSVQQTLGQTQQDFAETQRELQKSQQEKSALDKAMAEKSEQLEETIVAKQSVEQDLQNAYDQIDALRAEITTHLQALNEADQEKQELAEKVQVANNQLLLMQENMDQYNGQLAVVQQENKEMHQQLALQEVELRRLAEVSQELEEWEGKAEALQADKDRLKDELHEANIRMTDLNAQVNSALQQVAETQQLRISLVEAEKQVEESNQKVSRLQNKLEDVQGQMSYTGKNQLRIIKGIGPTYAKRLNEYGIFTLADLAKATPDEVRQIIKAKKWQAINVDTWVEEAKTLSLRFPEEEALD